ncbi:MAG: hypothetical protein JO104_06920 [Candidatus Eremiobacteraeota bacterium]|nr:hypothetical protein [Candidatus Eremiobacteraeota bacterium]
MVPSARSGAVWRNSLLGSCALVAAIITAEVALKTTIWGSFHIAIVTTAQPFVDRISRVAAQPALRVGDLVDLRKLSPRQRFVWRYYDARAGERWTLPVIRDGRSFIAGITATKATYFGKPFFSLESWPYWLAVAGYFWMTLFAAVIALRRSQSVEARLLALLLLTTVSGTVLVNWRSTLPALDDVLNVLGAILGTAATAFLAAYAMLFHPASRLRRAFAWLAYASVAVASAIVAVGAVGLWTLTIDPAGTLLSGKTSQIAYNFLPFLFPVLCTAAALAETRGAERTRIAWAAGSLSVLYGADCIAEFAIIFFPSVDLSAVYLFANVASFLAPVSLTYALLKRRLLDIGFVLNQAAVFSGVSIIVVGLFMLGEWVLGNWFSRLSHVTNLEISAMLALALGFSVRAIHTRVDRVLDQMFFRKRHDDETAIRAFGERAFSATDADALVHRTKEVLETHADAEFVTIVMDDGTGRYGDVSERDPAIAALHDREKALDLHGIPTQLRGEFAYPMIARGRLVGALVLGPKRSGESYAPDESNAIAQLAREVGGALHILTLSKLLQQHHLQA